MPATMFSRASNFAKLVPSSSTSSRVSSKQIAPLIYCPRPVSVSYSHVHTRTHTHRHTHIHASADRRLSTTLSIKHTPFVVNRRCRYPLRFARVFSFGMSIPMEANLLPMVPRLSSAARMPFPGVAMCFCTRIHTHALQGGEQTTHTHNCKDGIR